jgi:hypothetical protein
MTPIEIMALVFALIGAVKIIVLLTQPKSWMNLSKTIYQNSFITMIVSLVLAGVLLGYLLTEMTIVQIFAVMLFMAPLMAIGVSAYSKEALALMNKLAKDKTVVKRAWLAIVVWVILIIWVLYAIFA